MTDLAALIILDGFAERQEVYGNAVKQASMPNFKKYMDTSEIKAQLEQYLADKGE